MIDARSYLKLANPCHLLATGFGVGLSPIVPGTMGTLASIPFWLLMYWLIPIYFCWLLILISFVVGIVVCQQTTNDIQFHDHDSIVLDEFIGMWITLMAIPTLSVCFLFIAFILFRFFDMLKVWPISWFDRKVGGGLGIMLDDVIAAIFSIIIISSFFY